MNYEKFHVRLQYFYVGINPFPCSSTEHIAELQIERVGGVSGAGAPLTAKQMDDGLKNASTLVAGASMLFAR